MVPEEPTIGELVRRVERVEDRLDLRTLTTELFAAEKAAVILQINNVETKILSVERDVAEIKQGQRATRNLVLGALLAGAVQLVLLVLALLAKP